MIGERLSHYKILERLGSGGMGIVYRALDESLGRDVAIKVLHREVMHDPDRLARFEFEAKAIARLAHPNILAIHDFGNTGGVAFAVTELLEGETLAQRLKREHLHWRKAVAIAASIAEGLAAAHAKGITHRDIKPENIFLTTDGRVKILDFGLAHAIIPQVMDPLAPTLTVPHMKGDVVGTVAYMSPEQLRGEKADARSDIFTLGCVIYEMLTAQRAFSRGSFAVTVTAILMDPAPEVHVSGVEATEELNRIVGRCLEKNPGERFQSASDLAFALRSLLAEKRGVHAPAEAAHAGVADATVIAAKPETREKKPGDSGLKGKWLSRILIPAAVLCVLAIAAGLWFPFKREITLAVLPSENAVPGTNGLDESLAEKLNQKISELGIIKVTPLVARQSIDGMGQDWVGIAKKLHASALLNWRYRQPSGENLEIYVEVIDGDTGLAWLSRTFSGQSSLITETITDIARYAVETLRPRLGQAENDLLECLRLYAKARDELNTRSPDSLKSAIKHFGEALKKNPNYALAHVGIADSYNLLGIYGMDDPATAFQSGIKAATAALNINSSLAEAHISLGFARERYGFARQDAERDYEKAIRLSTSRDSRASAYHRLGVHLSDLGKYQQAIENILRAQKEDPSSKIMMSDLARPYLHKGDFKEAIRVSEETIARFPTFAPAYRYLGLAYEQTREFDRAIESLEMAMRLSGNSPLMKGDLGHVYASAGKKDKALSILSELQQERKSGQYRSCFLIAQIYACLGDNEAALNHLERAVQEKDPFLLSLEIDPIFKKKLGLEPRFRQLTQQLAQQQIRS